MVSEATGMSREVIGGGNTTLLWRMGVTLASQLTTNLLHFFNTKYSMKLLSNVLPLGDTILVVLR